MPLYKTLMYIIFKLENVIVIYFMECLVFYLDFDSEMKF